jgi:D-glycero-alpha-D-manno-heptose-7-phosphate kinase
MERAELRTIVARAPTRIDFGGGWTDVPPYPEEQGGFVCNLAIARYATARATVGLAHQSDDDADQHGTTELVQAALRRASLEDVRVVLDSDFPISAGLGGSSAAGVAVNAAIARLRGEALSREQLAERSRSIEVDDLGNPGGRQDHYAAAFGGALGLRFGAGVEVQRISLTSEFRAALERRCMLVYTGQSRISGDTITAVRSGYAAAESHVVGALARMKTLAIGMAAALAAQDLDALGALVREHWLHQRSLHPAITTPTIEALVAAADAAGASACKPLGASGGGCVLVMAPGDALPAVRRATAPFGDEVRFRVDDEGVTISEDAAAFPAAIDSLSHPAERAR